MTQFNLEQLSAALSALGISVPKMDAPPALDVRANASPDVAAGPLFSIYCSNCAYPNMVPTSAVPMLMGIPLPCPRSGGQSSPTTTRVPSAPNLSNHLNHIRPAHSASAPAVQPAQAPVAPPPVVSAPAPTPSPSQPAALTAAAGPDGPWYVVSKGRSVGVFRGWQTVSNLVTGVGRVCFFRHGTRAAAEAAFNEALAAGAVEIL
ncbi:uncharacterized protein ARMOST_12885 [Armillaria ostoyae]|uniref:Ribonuclease H1 N-terminal domain-containing protein n=1 Tax=Armillaria ostoyae TaxID=47428 RepID=A0A284RL71_ARMOS|nr:uncharacterized protein ARMOST_12885 [Armillaria ostoyae]